MGVGATLLVTDKEALQVLECRKVRASKKDKKEISI